MPNVHSTSFRTDSNWRLHSVCGWLEVCCNSECETRMSWKTQWTEHANLHSAYHVPPFVIPSVTKQENACASFCAAFRGVKLPFKQIVNGIVGDSAYQRVIFWYCFVILCTHKPRWTIKYLPSMRTRQWIRHCWLAGPAGARNLELARTISQLNMRAISGSQSSSHSQFLVYPGCMANTLWSYRRSVPKYQNIANTLEYDYTCILWGKA